MSPRFLWRVLVVAAVLALAFTCGLPGGTGRAHRRLIGLLERSTQAAGLTDVDRHPAAEIDCHLVPGFFKVGERRELSWPLRVSFAEAQNAADVLEHLWREEGFEVTRKTDQHSLLVATDSTGGKFSLGFIAYSTGLGFLNGNTGC